jgi:rRNA maturation endonuclease Nob1
MDYGSIWTYNNGDISMSVRPKSVCDNCSAVFVLVHELPEEEYTEQYCPFCGEEHEEIQEDVLLNEDWD